VVVLGCHESGGIRVVVVAIVLNFSSCGGHVGDVAVLRLTMFFFAML